MLSVLGSATRPDDSSGFFFADRFSFGTPLYRSRLEAAIQNATGVAGVRSIKYRQRGAFAGFVDLPEIVSPAPSQILQGRQRSELAGARHDPRHRGGRTMTYPICSCDGADIAPPVNLPELAHIAYRTGTYADFRRALLTSVFTPALPEPLPAEQTLSVGGVPVWRTGGQGDLAEMIAEWFAYVADILCFYNEQIANQDYLRTAGQPDSVANLIALLGYRPRPAIGATGTLAAILSPGSSFGGRSVMLPKGLQFQSKPTSGEAPQLFELATDTAIAAPDQLPATPPPVLLGQVAAPPIWLPPHHPGGHGPVIHFLTGRYSILLQGAVKTIEASANLLLRARDPASDGGPWLTTVISSTIGPTPSGSGQQTSLVTTLSGTAPTNSLRRPGESRKRQPKFRPVEHQVQRRDRRLDPPSGEPGAADPARAVDFADRR